MTTLVLALAVGGLLFTFLDEPNLPSRCADGWRSPSIGPFFLQFRPEAGALALIPGRGPLKANASAAQSGWMDWIAERLAV
jgi:hypothetical protein